VTHRGARVGVAGGDLDVPEVQTRVEHGHDEGVAEHVRVRPGDPHASRFGQAPQAAGGGVAVHPGAAAVEQDRAAGTGADRAVDGAPDRWRQRDQDDLGPFSAHPQHSVAAGARSWVQLAARQPKTILSLREFDDPPFPGVARFCVDVDEVLGLYPGWQDRLREIKGIYVLVDKRTGEQYVGSAKGGDSLWGRFCDYARTGDGGNAELKNRHGARYQVSILQIVDDQLPDYGIEEIESWWKRKLMTREHGLNRN
jgi:hypothetical protein